MYVPGTGEAHLWRSETTQIDPEWTFLGEKKITLRNPIVDSNLTVVNFIQSEIFVRSEPEVSDVLILSRAHTAGSAVTFSALGGTKVDHGDQIYRENIFGFFSNSTDPEYRRYFDMLRQNKIDLAPAYRVRVLDRLPVDTTLIRIMELTPAHTADTLPPFKKLYPQERQEKLLRGFFK